MGMVTERRGENTFFDEFRWMATYFQMPDGRLFNTAAWHVLCQAFFREPDLVFACAWL